MARGGSKTRGGGPVEYSEWKARKKREMVESGDYIWMILAQTGEPVVVENRPEAIAKKKSQGYLEAEVVEETVKRPIVKRHESSAEAPKRGPGRPRKVQSKDGE